MKTFQEVYDLIALGDELMFVDDLLWDARNGELTASVNCSDFFGWACADAEEIEHEDLPALRQAILECRAVGANANERIGDGPLLWAARKRCERPIQPHFEKWSQPIRDLFEEAASPKVTP